MKKLLFLCLTLPFLSFSQSAYEGGKIIFEAYGGLPNWANSLLYPTIKKRFNNVENFGSNGSIWSFGGRASYFLQERVSIGLDVNHEVSGCYFDYEKLEENTQLYIDFNANYTSRKTRFLIRSDFHIVNNRHFNMYLGIGIGYKHVKRTIIASEPNFDDKKLNLRGAVFPVTGRIALGARYYFTDNIGAMVELGAGGGSLLQFGISAKF